MSDEISVDGLSIRVRLDGEYTAKQVDQLVRHLQWAADEATKVEIDACAVGDEVTIGDQVFRITSVTVQRFGEYGPPSVRYGADRLTKKARPGPDMPIVLFHEEIKESRA